METIRVETLGGNNLHWVSALDIYKLAGKPDKKGVGNWLKLHSTINLIGNVANILNVDTEKLHKFVPGRNGCTWLYWYLALEYSMYISMPVRLQTEIYLSNVGAIDSKVTDLLNSKDLYKASEIGWLQSEHKYITQEYVRAVTEKQAYNYQDAALVTSLCLFGDVENKPDVLVDSEQLRARNDLQRLINNRLKNAETIQGVKQVREVIKQTSVAWLNFQSVLMNQNIPQERLDRVEAFPNLI